MNARRWLAYMMLSVELLLCAVALGGADRPSLPTADPLKGKLALTQKGCIQCHSVWGVGGKLAPDLAAAGSDQSFQQMASMFWNHTPKMVQMLKQKGTEWPVLSENEMADIISFIYYLKLLDAPGDPANGRAVFHEKKCDECHSLGEGALSLGRFSRFVSPVHLAQAMWNAGTTMRQAQRARGIAMPLFQGREMADLQAYIRQAGPSLDRSTYLKLPDIGRGGMLFREKGCARCHQQGRGGAGPDLSREPLRKSISEICGTVWNHSLAMQAKMQERGVASARLDGTELADILGHIYFLHFSRDEGDAARGERVFRTKGCFACHSGGGVGKQGPNLASGGRRYDMLGLATSMWNHAPIMFETMESQIMKWIKLDPDDMQDLSRYLKSIRGEEESAIRESRR